MWFCFGVTYILDWGGGAWSGGNSNTLLETVCTESKQTLGNQLAQS